MKLKENDIASVIVDAAIEAHPTLGGPGLLESVYQKAPLWELDHRGLKGTRQVPLPILCKSRFLVSPQVIDVFRGPRYRGKQGHNAIQCNI